MADLKSYLPELLDRLKSTPIHEVMREDERSRGNIVVIPGDVEWLSADDWLPSAVISLSGNEVRIIAIIAKQRGNGSFKRLVAQIIGRGLHPIVIEPFHDMKAILTKWNWQGRRVGIGFHSEEQWRPRKALEIA